MREVLEKRRQAHVANLVRLKQGEQQLIGAIAEIDTLLREYDDAKEQRRKRAHEEPETGNGQGGEVSGRVDETADRPKCEQ